MKNGPFFSVVIPTHNRNASLGDCLAALERQEEVEGLFEVIVVVDGSTDGTIETLKAQWTRPWLRSVSLPRGGASAARNAGINHARGEFIALTEDDVLPDSRWLAEAREGLLRSGADVLEGATVYPGGSGPVRKLEPGGILSFLPCNLFIRRSLFQTVGSYDPAFFDADRNLYFREDADLGFRLLESGVKALRSDDVRVTHPRQFTTVDACLHHARRYVFDPLLYRRHPRLYRSMIEVKEIGGFRVHRPQHYVALLYGLGLAGLVASLIVQSAGGIVVSGLTIAVCAFLFRVKYHGKRAFAIHRLRETAGFLILPAVYLGAVLTGVFRYRAPGVLL